MIRVSNLSMTGMDCWNWNDLEGFPDQVRIQAVQKCNGFQKFKINLFEIFLEYSTGN
jgi:hypothetical protein